MWSDPVAQNRSQPDGTEQFTGSLFDPSPRAEAVAALSASARAVSVEELEVLTGARHRWGAPTMTRWAAGGVLLLVMLVCGVIVVRSWQNPTGQVETIVSQGSAGHQSRSPSSGPSTARPSVEPVLISAVPQAGVPVIVHVVGKVRRPGLVTLTPQARVSDAVRAAGGAAPGAALARINLARHVQDGEQILIPDADDPVPGPAVGPTSSPGVRDGDGAGVDGSAVRLNTATLAELDALPGIGPVLAQRILDWRGEHGRFTRVEELTEVEGIGPSLLAKLAGRVTV